MRFHYREKSTPSYWPSTHSYVNVHYNYEYMNTHVQEGAKSKKERGGKEGRKKAQKGKLKKERTHAIPI